MYERAGFTMRLLFVVGVLLQLGFLVLAKDEIVASPEEIAKREPDGDHILQEESHGSQVLIPPDGEVTAAAVRRAEALRYPSRKPDKFKELMEETDIREIHRIIVPPIKDVDINQTAGTSNPVAPVAAENQPQTTPASVTTEPSITPTNPQKPNDVRFKVTNTPLKGLNSTSHDDFIFNSTKTVSVPININTNLLTVKITSDGKNENKIIGPKNDNGVTVTEQTTTPTKEPLKEHVKVLPIVDIKTRTNIGTELKTAQPTTTTETAQTVSFQRDPIIVQEIAKPSAELLPPYEEVRPVANVETPQVTVKPINNVLQLQEVTKPKETTTISSATTKKSVSTIQIPSQELELPLEDSVSEKSAVELVNTATEKLIKEKIDQIKDDGPENFLIPIPNKAVTNNAASIESNSRRVGVANESTKTPKEETAERVPDVTGPPTLSGKNVLDKQEAPRDEQPLLGNIVIKNVNWNENSNRQKPQNEQPKYMELPPSQILVEIHLSLAPYSDVIAKALHSGSIYAKDYQHTQYYTKGEILKDELMYAKNNDHSHYNYPYISHIQKRSTPEDSPKNESEYKFESQTRKKRCKFSRNQAAMSVAEALYQRRQILGEG